MTSLRSGVKLGLMKKKDNRLDIKDKSGWIGSIIGLCTFGFYFYIFGVRFVEYFSFKTGVCENCFGPLKFFNNPVPLILIMLACGVTLLVIFKFFIRSEWTDREYFDK